MFTEKINQISPIEAQNIEEISNASDELKKNQANTPAIPASKPGDRCHGEMHRPTPQHVDECNAEEVRSEVCSHYRIPLEHVIVAPEISGRKREVRAFTILEHKSDLKKKYYADGHLPHAFLLNMIFDRFSKDGVSEESKIGISNRDDLPDDFEENWTTKKGFIDPYVDNFRSFKGTHELLKKVMTENGRLNNLSPEEAEEIRNNPEAVIPNWIRSG